MQQFNIAQLYLRFIIGITLSLHNIYKLQHIEQIVDFYPNQDGLSNVAWFYLIILIQVVCSIMLMIGLYIRFAAATLTFGTIALMMVLFPHLSINEMSLYSLYAFIFIYLWIVGGGSWAIDRVLRS